MEKIYEMPETEIISVGMSALLAGSGDRSVVIDTNGATPQGASQAASRAQQDWDEE